MLRFRHFLRRQRFSIDLVMPVAMAVVVIAAIVAVLLTISTRRADEAYLDDQRQLVALVLRQSLDRLSHDQEASTVWDEAVRRVTGPMDAGWLDDNLGTWFHKYFGHDRVYIVNGRDEPVYAMIDGARAEAARFEGARAAAMPLIRQLRGELTPGDHPALAPTQLSPSAVDIDVVDGRPAILSVKPIISDTGALPQAPEQVFLHVSVRYLDGSFLADLTRNYRFSGARFAWRDDSVDGEAAYPLLKRSGSTLGSFIWKPYLPAGAVMATVVPWLGAALLAVSVIIARLLGQLRSGLVALRSSEARAQHLALHDTLTGLPNRTLFDDRLDATLSGAAPGAAQLAVLYLDLDRFKQVNDTLGHPGGDELIREIGRRIRAEIRDSDTVARLGGDEFAIMLPGVGSRETVEALAQRIIASVSRPCDILGTRAFVGVSIGIALSPLHGRDRTELMRKADIALYRAKTSGRNRLTVFGSDMDDAVREHRAIERDLRLALERGNELAVHYQPVYSAGSGAVVGVEALVRWRHPQRGALSPAGFIPIAEESGLIDQLGAWVLRQASIAATRWPVGTMSVNVSAVQLRNPDFARQVLAIIRETGLAPERLELEMTETALFEAADQVRPILDALRKAGVRIALDDFGTGYSSLAHLRSYDIDRVKIDRSFVSTMDVTTGENAIVQAIVDMAQASGIRITAEGVETAEQSRFLARIGCDEQQGYFLSRPLPSTEIDRMFNVTPLLLAGPKARRDAA